MFQNFCVTVPCFSFILFIIRPIASTLESVVLGKYVVDHIINLIFSGMLPFCGLVLFHNSQFTNSDTLGKFLCFNQR